MGTQGIRLQVGIFVRTPDKYGLGKLVEIVGDQGVVRFRHSASETEERRYPLRQLQRWGLARQERAFWHDPATSSLRAGRVLDVDAFEKTLVYTVRFPNGKDCQIPETELEARSLKPNQDAAGPLAGGWFETQFYYDRRLAALRALIHARAANRGLTGLTSAAVELIPHQVEVISRISSDPVQRYLLADEVGLGKTIEAGAVIRQALLDDPSLRVVVLVPVSLVRQWERELTTKFGINLFPGRVTVRPFDSLPELKPDASDLLVIDEAHHLVSPDGAGASPERYAHLARLAHSCRRLLVLSATPVLGDEEAMLRLLHLLDPVVHRLEEREGFRRKLANRQLYGRLLMALDPDLPPSRHARLGEQFLQAFPGDEVVAVLAGGLVKPDSDPKLSVVERIRSLKRHVAETYRLHQRLLRTRRKDLPEWEMLPRAGEVRLVAEPDQHLVAVMTELDAWRYNALVAVTDQSPELESAMANRFRRLFEALSQGASELSLELERQAHGVKVGREASFAGDEALMQQLRLILQEGPGPDAAVAAAGRLVGQALSTCPRVGGVARAVVFTSSHQLAVELGAHLTRKFGRDAVGLVAEYSSQADIEAAVSRFSQGRQDMVLVCDRSGEEGLNLHMADTVVHLDLPLDPARLEQRIGRVDRFGRQGNAIRHFVRLPVDHAGSPWVAWQNLLAEGFGLYSDSISDVQFLLKNVEERLVLDLFRRSSQGLTEAIGWVREELVQERRRLDEQYALDQMAMAESEMEDEVETESLFTILEQGDESERYEDLNRWLEDAMLFLKVRDRGVKDIFQLKWTDNTLIPKIPWLEHFEPSLGTPLTYERRVAVKNPQTQLIRPGSHLVDVLERHLLWDDRGVAFATWRVDPRWETEALGEWIGFRLTYVVEFNMARVISQLGDRVEPSVLPSIRRRADALFAPWVETLTLDAAMKQECTPVLLDILSTPYRAADKGGNDYNLGSRRDALFRLITPERFSDMVMGVSATSRTLIEASPEFRGKVAAAAEWVRSELLQQNRQLERRQAAIHREGGSDPTLAHEIAINQAIIDATISPQVRLDAIGCFVVSNRAPDKGDGR